MAPITRLDLTERFPEFKDLDGDVIGTAVREACGMVHVSKDATLHCAAHLLAIREQETGTADGGSGEVIQEFMGPQQLYYQAMAEKGREVFFSTTRYGRQVLLLEARSPKIAMGMISV